MADFMARLGTIQIPPQYIRSINAFMGGAIQIKGAILVEDLHNGWFEFIKQLEEGEVMQLISRNVNGIVQIESEPLIVEKTVGNNQKKLFTFTLNLKRIA